MSNAITLEVKKGPGVILIEQALLLQGNPRKTGRKNFCRLSGRRTSGTDAKRTMAYSQDFDDILSYCLDAVRYRYDEFSAPTRWYADVIFNGSL